jgi:hypothetical protein
LDVCSLAQAPGPAPMPAALIGSSRGVGSDAQT